VHSSTYLPQYKVQDDGQEKRENVALFHQKDFSSKAEVKMVSSQTLVTTFTGCVVV